MNQTELLQSLEQGALVLTPNRRLAAYLKKLYNQHQQEHGKLVWPSPTINTLTSWLEEQWQQNDNPSLLLNEHQTLSCWEQVVADLFNSQTTAQSAYDAWKILQTWQIDIEKNTFNYNVDSQAFFDWAQSYQEKIQQLHACDVSLIPSRLIKHHDLFQLPPQIIFACFDEFTPVIDTLISILKNKTKINYFDNRLKKSQVNVLACLDRDTEYFHMAQWALQQLLAGRRYIGCVIPNLHQQRDNIERIFSQLISDKHQFNISGGQPFINFPVIHHAFNALHLSDTSDLSLSLISTLLRSPYIGDANSEKASRALLDAKLHERGELSISRENLLHWTKKFTPKLHLLLTQCFTHAYPKSTSPSSWSNYFSQFLGLLGWPGEESLTSHEYQVVQRWLEFLSDFARLDVVIHSLTFFEALSKLKQLASNTQFQTQSTTSPIQILGILEAAGMTFDALWVSGLDDENWPVAANPNPFIPLPLQRQFKLPHADAERELTFSKQLTQRFAVSAEHVIFSHALKNNDRMLRPSSLITSFPSIDATELHLSKIISQAEQQFSTRDIEMIEENNVPQVTPEEIIQGGSGILKSQSACPFQAFAKVRLHADGIDEPHLGLNALQRGVILHRTLEMIWRELKTHEKLCTLNDHELSELISPKIRETLHHFRKIVPHHLSPRFLELEHERLLHLLKTWLQLEKQRPLFKVISQEVEQNITLGNIRFKLRVDRIDQLENGKKIIIDYKTSKTSIKDWFGERLSEPQLPLYSLSDEEIAGLLFAQVKIDDLCFKGLTETNANIANVNTFDEIKNEDTAHDWNAQRDRWREELTKLARDFENGHAIVDPKNNETCNRCDLQGFCRINENNY